jgi:hypothetical protein
MIALVLALSIQGQKVVGPPPPLYRWKSGKGEVRVTTTVPPPDAIIVETLHHKGDELVEDEVYLVPDSTPEELRTGMEAVLRPETVTYWRGIDETLAKARRSGDTLGQMRTLDRVMAAAMLGNGLWALLLLPALLASTFILLAWWASVGLSSRSKVSIWVCSAAACLTMCHVGLQVVIFGPLARRLDLALSMLPNYLGDRATIGADGGAAMAAHVDSISKACSPTSFVWTFPIEVYRARQAAASMIENLGAAELVVEVISMNSASSEHGGAQGDADDSGSPH